MRSLSRFGVGQAVTLRERSVLAVCSEVESRAQVVERSAKLVPDGFTVILGQFSGRETADESGRLIQTIERSKAQVIAVDTTPSVGFLSRLIQTAQSHRIALVQIKDSFD